MIVVRMPGQISPLRYAYGSAPVEMTGKNATLRLEWRNDGKERYGSGRSDKVSRAE